MKASLLACALTAAMTFSTGALAAAALPPIFDCAADAVFDGLSFPNNPTKLDPKQLSKFSFNTADGGILWEPPAGIQTFAPIIDVLDIVQRGTEAGHDWLAAGITSSPKGSDEARISDVEVSLRLRTGTAQNKGRFYLVRHGTIYLGVCRTK